MESMVTTTVSPHLLLCQGERKWNFTFLIVVVGAGKRKIKMNWENVNVGVIKTKCVLCLLIQQNTRDRERAAWAHTLMDSLDSSTSSIHNIILSNYNYFHTQLSIVPNNRSNLSFIYVQIGKQESTI